MQEAKKTANRRLAEKMIEKLKLRRMEGFYVETKEEALALVKEKFLTQGKSVCYGGSVTLQETGIMDWLKESPCDVIDRTAFSTPEEEKEIKARMINSDYFLMSTNAITTDGELINIDGRANRELSLLWPGKCTCDCRYEQSGNGCGVRSETGSSYCLPAKCSPTEQKNTLCSKWCVWKLLR